MWRKFKWDMFVTSFLVAGEGLALACGLRQGLALGRHRRPIHSHALQVLPDRIKKKVPVGTFFFMVAGEGLEPTTSGL